MSSAAPGSRPAGSREAAEALRISAAVRTPFDLQHPKVIEAYRFIGAFGGRQHPGKMILFGNSAGGC
jgi:hypothetical protein